LLLLLPLCLDEFFINFFLAAWEDGCSVADDMGWEAGGVGGRELLPPVGVPWAPGTTLVDRDEIDRACELAYLFRMDELSELLLNAAACASTFCVLISESISSSSDKSDEGFLFLRVVAEAGGRPPLLRPPLGDGARDDSGVLLSVGVLTCALACFASAASLFSACCLLSTAFIWIKACSTAARRAVGGLRLYSRLEVDVVRRKERAASMGGEEEWGVGVEEKRTGPESRYFFS